MMLLRRRRRLERELKRGPIISDQSGPIAEHHERVAEEAVGEALLPGLRVVLLDGPGRNVALAAAVEVAGGAVVDGVVEAPVLERLPDEQRGEAADPAVGRLALEERAVAAVVEDDEGAQQEAAGRNRQPERQPDRLAERQVHEHRQRQIRHDGGREVEQAAAEPRLGVGGQIVLIVSVVALDRVMLRQSGDTAR